MVNDGNLHGLHSKKRWAQVYRGTPHYAPQADKVLRAVRYGPKLPRQAICEIVMPPSSALFLLLEMPADFRADTCVAQLSASSRLKFEQLRSAARTRQFLLGRWLMTTAASRLLETRISLEDIDDSGPFPALQGHPQLHASISHSANLIGVIVSRNIRIGLDLEYTAKARDTLALAQRAFAPSEIEALQQMPAAERNAAFYQIWTWREAACKAGLLTHVVGDLAVSSGQAIHSQSGHHGHFAWSAVSAHTFTLAPETIIFPAD
jgi:phosphopantetheinyl transferase